MKTNLLPLLIWTLCIAGCQQKNEPTPIPDAGTTVICFPLSVTASLANGVNEIFTYNKQGYLEQREYFTRTDTVHHFEYFYNNDKDMIGLIEKRRHSPNSPKESYYSISYRNFDYAPLYKNHYPAQPVNTLIKLGEEVYLYDAQYELKEFQIIEDYRLVKSLKFTNGNKLIRHVEEYDGPTGEKVREINLEYDEMLHPHKQNVAYAAILVGLGWPHAHNIKQAMVYNGDGMLLEEESYRNTFTYNEQGYPLTVKQDFLNGVSHTYTYTYNCPDISQ